MLQKNLNSKSGFVPLAPNQLQLVCGGDAPPGGIPGSIYDETTGDYDMFGFDPLQLDWSAAAPYGEGESSISGSEISPGVWDTTGDGHGDTIVVTPPEDAINFEWGSGDLTWDCCSWSDPVTGMTVTFDFFNMKFILRNVGETMPGLNPGETPGPVPYP